MRIYHLFEIKNFMPGSFTNRRSYCYPLDGSSNEPVRLFVQLCDIHRLFGYSINE